MWSPTLCSAEQNIEFSGAKDRTQSTEQLTTVRSLQANRPRMARSRWWWVAFALICATFYDGESQKSSLQVHTADKKGPLSLNLNFCPGFAGSPVCTIDLGASKNSEMQIQKIQANSLKTHQTHSSMRFDLVFFPCQ